MLVGRFVDGERVVIPLVIYDANEEEIEIEATIDTGFLGELLLPYSLVQRLQLPRITDELVSLADGTLTRLPVYSGVIQWADDEREVDILSAVREYPLIGMELLRGGIVHLELFDGGDITIEEGE